jgi:hypothetical protein
VALSAAIKMTAAVSSATIEVSNPIAAKSGAVEMNCSTNLHLEPIIPRLPGGLALILALSILVHAVHFSGLTQMSWLAPATWAGRRGWWSTIQVRRRSRNAWLCLLPSLLARTLARCALLIGLLHLNGWLPIRPLSGCVLLVPVGQGVLLLWARVARRATHRARQWANGLLRLYQMTLLALLIGVLHRLVEQAGVSVVGWCAVCLPFTWHTRPDEQTEVTITTLDADQAHPLGHYQVTLRGNFSLTWQPRDSFERWLLILFLRKLHKVDASCPVLSQTQVGQGCGVHQYEVSLWETRVRQHGWHTLSDRYRHQLNSALPDPKLSRQILDLWVPAFWLSAWEVRERLITRGVIPDRAALSCESLLDLAHHTGFGRVRQMLLARFQVQEGQLIAKEQWWLNELLALNARLLSKLEQGERITPQELVDIEALRLPTPPKNVDPASPPLVAALRQTLFALPTEAADEPVCCTYCGSTHTSAKSKKPRLKTVIDPLTGQKQHIEVLRRYCHNPECTRKTFTHFPQGVLPHSPHPLQARLVAVEVYERLLSTYRRSACLLDVSAATAYRWVVSLSPAATALAAYLGAVRTSGVVGIDDKWLLVCSPSAVRPHGKRLRAVWRYAYFAIDVYSYDILALELYPQHNDQAVHLLLLELKAKGVTPRIVVTDLDPAYGRMLPIVFPKAVHHECIFHAIQNALSQLTRVYGRHYAEQNPQAAALHEVVVHLFRAKTQKTVRKRFHDLMALRDEYVARTPEVACVFDSLERHFPKLVNAFENPLIPTTNNATELVIRRFDQHYQSMCGLDSLESARLYLRVFEFVFRLTPFASDNPTRHIRGKCPLELAGYDLEALPIAEFFAQLKLPTLVISGEEVVSQ